MAVLRAVGATDSLTGPLLTIWMSGLVLMVCLAAAAACLLEWSKLGVECGVE